MSSSEEDSACGEVKSPRTPYVNLYCFDREKCKEKFQKNTFDDIVKGHALTVGKEEINRKEIPCDQSQCITKCIKIIFADDQKVQTQTQVEAKLKKTKNAFSIWYFEGKDGNIYVAGEGRSYNCISHLADHKFPEMVFDRHLDEDVLELHAQRLLGRVALYSEQYRQEYRIMDNLWQYLNSLTTKMKVAVRADSDLGKFVLKEPTDVKKKVFVDVNFQKNSVQIKKALHEHELVQVLDIMSSSFKRPSSGKCALLRLVSRVRDEPTRQKLNKLLGDRLESAGTRTGGASLSAIQVVDPFALHATEDAWNSTTEIVLKLPTVRETTFDFKPDNACKHIQEADVPQEDIRVIFKGHDGKIQVVSGKDYMYLEMKQRGSHATVVYLEKPDKRHRKEKAKMTRSMTNTVTHRRHTEPWSELFGELYKKFRDRCKHFDVLFWLDRVVVEYGEKKKKKFLTLLESRQPFLLDNMSYTYFHGEWLSFNPRFHSLLEVHFLELMKTRSIESNLILPVPWLKTDLSDSQKAQFGKFIAAWLRRSEVTNEAPPTLETNSTYKELRQSLGSDMTEPHYNEMYLLVDQLMQINDQGGKSMEVQKQGFLVGDGVTVKGGMELFDVMYYDELNVFFIHVKRGFNAKNMREVVDQVRHSAEYMQCLFLKGGNALQTEMRKFLTSLMHCKEGGDKATCPRHKNIKWACELNKKCTEKFDAKDFANLLKTHKKHWVLAYGGRSMEDASLRKVEGKEIGDVLEEGMDCIPRLEEKGYVQVQKREERMPSAAKKPRRDEGTYALTRRFCIVEEENFLKDMTNGNPEENVKELKKLYQRLKSAISQTELNACKMAFLNLFESFKNIKDMTLWFSRIAHRSPDDEETEEVVACLQNLHLWPQD